MSILLRSCHLEQFSSAWLAFITFCLQMSMQGHHQHACPTVWTQQPKLTLSPATLNNLPGRKLFPPTSLGLHLNQAVLSSQHIGAEMRLFGTLLFHKKLSISFLGSCMISGAFPEAPLCALHVLTAAIKPMLWVMNCELQLQTVYGQLQKNLILFERSKRNMKSMEWWVFLTYLYPCFSLIMYLLD